MPRTRSPLVRGFSFTAKERSQSGGLSETRSIVCRACGSDALSPTLILSYKPMASVGTYLNFSHSTEDAFNFYRSVFGTEFAVPFVRFKDLPPQPDQPPLSPADKNLILHVALPLLGGHLLMGSDAPESLGFKVNAGNNVHISLRTDTRAEADGLFAKLSAEGQVEMPLQDMFWGDYYGSFTDKFGIRWMIACAQKA